MFTIIIPIRFNSKRLPGKALLDIHGKPVIIRTVEKAQLSNAKSIIVATDHKKIFDLLKKNKIEVCMTKTSHQSGTERISEVIEKYKIPDNEIIIHLQGDEPLIHPKIINQLAKNFKKKKNYVATLGTPIQKKKEIFNPSIVKIVTDKYNNALYFSRSPIPWNQNNNNKKRTKKNLFLRHIGIYAYQSKFLKKYIKWEKSPLESIESLEQLRILWNGEKIYVNISKKKTGPGLDNKNDLKLIRKIFFSF